MTWQPYREPFRVTLIRTSVIAVGAGAVIALRRGDLTHWPAWILLALWPTLGGHWLEIFFLNCLRPMLPAARTIQTTARVSIWFAGGVVLWLAMWMTAAAMGLHPARWEAWASIWWIGGIAFIALELVVHLVLQVRGRPSFFNGQA
jgi:hypothetical protein